MASGTGERPLGTPGQEQSLMGLAGIKIATANVAPNATIYINIPESNGGRPGWIFFTSANANRNAVYSYWGNAGTTGSLTLTAVVPFPGSGVTVTKETEFKIKVVNGATAYVNIMVIGTQSHTPTITSS